MICYRNLIRVVLVSGLLNFSNAALAEKYSTDWLVPPIAIAKTGGDICAVDLEINSTDSGELSGTLILYSGQLKFDQFGDANKKLLQDRKIPVKLRKARIPDLPFESNKPPSDSTVLYEFAEQPTLNQFRVVLSEDIYRGTRLLVVSPDGKTDRVLPLQSKKLERQAEGGPPGNRLNLWLCSDVYSENASGTCIVTIRSAGATASFVADHNSRSIDFYGFLGSSTLMGFIPSSITLHDMELPDPTGRGRRVFSCYTESTLDERDRFNGPPIEKGVIFLVLDPREGGWHRVIWKRDGQVERMLPMHSVHFDSWIEIRSQLSDQTEQRVFDRIWEALPSFASFGCDENHVTRARLIIPEGNAGILKNFAELPALTQLELRGDISDGSELSKLTTLESLALGECYVSQDVLQNLARLKKLKSLDFQSARVDCRGLKYLRDLTELTNFSFIADEPDDFAEHYEDSCMDVFGKLPKLRNLKLHGMPLTDTAIMRLPVSKSLLDVSFGHEAPLIALMNFSKANPLARIHVSDCSWRLADGEVRLPSHVTDDDLREIKNLPGVHLLKLTMAKSITDEGLKHLVTLELTEFGLSHNANITDEGIEHLAEIKTLETLEFYGCENVTTKSFVALEQLPKLKKLKIGGTKIDSSLLQKLLPNCEIE